MFRKVYLDIARVKIKSVIAASDFLWVPCPSKYSPKADYWKSI